MVNTMYPSPFSAACASLPNHIADAVRMLVALYGGICSEIRLIRGGQAYITVLGKNVRSAVTCTDEDIVSTVRSLCGNSLYAHSETIREGFVFTASGLRVGVCGRAVVRDGHIERISDISSLSIRIPERHPGAADDLYPYVLTENGPSGMLIWSAPGVGKTTALRELALRLSNGPNAVRTALIDTRYELSCGIQGDLLDVFSGYPRAIGMEIAVRTMSPQIVICDEIAGQSDAQAVRDCVSGGVSVVASAHGSSLEGILCRKAIAELVREGVFATIVGLYREGGRIKKKITNTAEEVVPCLKE